MNDDFIYRALPEVPKDFAQSLYTKISFDTHHQSSIRSRIRNPRWVQVAIIILGILLLVAWSQVRLLVRYVPIGDLWLVEFARTTQIASQPVMPPFVPTSLPTPFVFDGTTMPTPDPEAGRFVLYFPSWIPDSFSPIEFPREMTAYEETLAIWINDSDEKIRLFIAPLAGGMHPYAPPGMYEEVRVNGQPAILIHGRLALKKPQEKSRKWDETLGLQLHWILGKNVYALETFGAYISQRDLIRMAESMKDIPPPLWTPNTP
jgi:hypothetical protein